jgi:hypothetical protein
MPHGNPLTVHGSTGISNQLRTVSSPANPFMVRQAHHERNLWGAHHERNAVGELTTNGILGGLTTNGVVGELTTNGVGGELAISGVVGELATSGNPFPALRRPFFNAHAGQGRNLITTTINAACAYNCDSIGSQPSTTTSSLRIRLASGSVPKTSGGASDQSSQRKRLSPSRYTQ